MIKPLEPVAATIGAWRRDVRWSLRGIVPDRVHAFTKSVRRRFGDEAQRREADADSSGGAFAALVADTDGWLENHLPKASADFHRLVVWKNDQKRLAEVLGIEVAHTYLSEVPLADALAYVEEAGLERFAIKPVWSRNSIGFRGLVRARSHDIYRDVTNDALWRLDALRRDLRREYAPLGREDRWILEELMLPVDGAPVPVPNYKFMCFGGRAEAVFQRLYVGGRKKYSRQMYDREWNPTRFTQTRKKLDPTVRVPLNGARLQAYAEEVASRLAFPFIRIDLYDTSRGIVLGEFTPGPGGLHRLLPDWDEYFRDRWLASADEIEQAIRSGTFLPPEPHDDPGDVVLEPGRRSISP